MLQIVPGVKDIRSTLANALAEGQSQDSSGPQAESLSDILGAGITDRQSIDKPITPGANLQSFGSYRPRSIRRLMSEKSMTMVDSLYASSSVEEPSEPLEVLFHTLTC